MDFRGNKRDKQSRLALDKGLREAVADYLRDLYPSGTAKHAAKRFNLSLAQARHAVAGEASIATLERIIKTGGWSVALAILADVIGSSIAHYFREMGQHHAENGRRLVALWSDYGPGPPDGHLRGGGGDRLADHLGEPARREVGQR